MFHRAMLHRATVVLVLGLAFWPLAAAADSGGIAARGAAVTFDQTCTLTPVSFREAGGFDIALWRAASPESPGIYITRWLEPDQLGTTFQIIVDEVMDFTAWPNPSSFLLVWRADDALRFRTYSSNPLAPTQPVTEVGTTTDRPAVALDAARGFAIAWVDGDGVKARRFASNGVPTTPIVTVIAGTGHHSPKIAVGSQGFLVAWNELLPGDDSLEARAFSVAGAPLGPVVELGLGAIELAPAADGYLAVRSNPELATRRLANDGQPLAAESGLGFPGFAVKLAAAPKGAWLAWESPGELWGAALDDLGLLADPPSQLVPPPPQYSLALSSLLATPGGFRLTWALAFNPPIPPDPCDLGIAGLTQDFGPGTVVDIPTLSRRALVVCALLLAIAGLWRAGGLRYRRSRSSRRWRLRLFRSRRGRPDRSRRRRCRRGIRSGRRGSGRRCARRCAAAAARRPCR